LKSSFTGQRPDFVRLFFFFKQGFGPAFYFVRYLAKDPWPARDTT
jgi:hypothetical protein